MEEKSIPKEITLESIKKELEQISMQEDHARMSYPLNSGDYHYISKKYYEVLKKLNQLKEEHKDDSLSKKIDVMIQEINKKIRINDSAAIEVESHENNYGSFGM